MENAQVYKALLQVAENEGIPLEEVIQETESAIREAVEQSKRDNNREALAMWAQIPCKGEYPTVVEFIAFMGSKIS